MGSLWPAALAGASLAVLGIPPPAALRLRAVLPEPAAPLRTGLAPPVRSATGALVPGAVRGSSAADARQRSLGAGVARALRSGTPVAQAWSVLAGGAAGLVLGGPAAAVLAAVAALLAPRLLRARTRQIEDRDEQRRAVEACAALAAELRAGRTPAQALAGAAELARGPSGSAFTAAAAAARWGAGVPEALLAPHGGVTAVPEVLRGLAACWQVCARAGSGLAPAVERLADGLRAREAQERAVAAALAGPQASAALLALLPAAGVALAAGLGARPLHVLLHTPLGVACLLLGVGLDALGLAWTRRIVVRAARAGA